MGEVAAGHKLLAWASVYAKERVEDLECPCDKPSACMLPPSGQSCYGQNWSLRDG